MNRVKHLLSYRYSEIIHDLTMEFVLLYISKFSRTKDQMEQAARSGKQNIVEGVGQSDTSKKGEIKLLGVAMASLDELLADYEDFLRQKGLRIYSKESREVSEFRRIAYRLSNVSNISPLGDLIEKPQLPDSPQDAANFLLTLCHMATYLLHRQIDSLKEKHMKEGGLTEELYRKRIEYRKKNS